MSTRRRSRPDRITVIKDMILFGLGIALIVRQGWLVSKADFNWIILAIGVGLTQAPGAMAMMSLLRTGGSSSAPPEPAQQLPSASPSPNDSTGVDPL